MSDARPLPPEKILFGTSGPAHDLCTKLSSVSDSDLPVVLRGEAGTGKELIARWIHEHSPFRDGAFVKAACINPHDDEACHLLVNDQPLPRGGLLEQLRQLRTGTLFLDDVENLALTTQVVISKMFEDGGTHTPQSAISSGVPLSFRIISATRNDLRQEVAQRILRPDFFHSISAFMARVPTLRERMPELPALVEYLVMKHASEMGLERAMLSPSSLQVMRHYAWPGNLRELDSTIISYVLTGDEEGLLQKVRVLDRSQEFDAGWVDAVPELAAAHPPPAVAARSHKIDDEALLRALKENRWNRRQTAGLLHMSYRSLLNRLKKIDMNTGRPGGMTVVH